MLITAAGGDCVGSGGYLELHRRRPVSSSSAIESRCASTVLVAHNVVKPPGAAKLGFSWQLLVRSQLDTMS